MAKHSKRYQKAAAAIDHDRRYPLEEAVRALMPGRVVEVAVKVGDAVPPGGLLLVLEAMKMQNEIRSVRGGAVVQLAVEKGRTVEGGALLLTLKPGGNESTGRELNLRPE